MGVRIQGILNQPVIRTVSILLQEIILQKFGNFQSDFVGLSKRSLEVKFKNFVKVWLQNLPFRPAGQSQTNPPPLARSLLLWS